MRKEVHHLKIESRLGSFIRLASVEILTAGVLTAIFAAGASTKLAMLASILAFIGGMAFLVPGQLGKQPGFQRKIISAAQQPPFNLIPSAIVLLVALLLFKLDLSTRLVWILSPVIVCVWLIGVEILLFFPSEGKNTHIGPTREPHERPAMLLGLVIALGIAIIPARIPSLLDGLPLDAPLEYILVTLLLPYAFITGGRFFAKKIVLSTMGFLLALKIIALFLLPQAGLGVRAYSSEEAWANDSWEKSYSTFLAPSYTQVLQNPYYTYRELPIEWINRNGFSADEFWVALELSGIVHLEDNERFVLVLEGAKQARIELVDVESRQAIPAVVIKPVKKVGPGLYQKIPPVQDFHLRAILVFETFGQYRIEPVILYPDGSTESALALSRIWITQDGPNLSLIRPVLGFVGLALIALLTVGLVIGLIDAYRANRINALDIYLGASALLFFYAACLVPRPEMNIALLCFVGALAGAKLLDHSASRREFSWAEFLVSIGPAFLLMFLALDISNFREVVIFPQTQDGLEYQILARNIYLNGDALLAQTPPRGYKVLFPYLVGLLHVIFGQSASAQLFLNTWCALLSSALVLKLSNAFRLPARISLSASLVFLSILFLPSSYIYYFRFGLIEPAAILCLLATCYFSITRNVSAMFAAGILTSLFRLDYLGGILGAVILTSDPITGMAGVAWGQFREWLGTRWKLLVNYSLSVIVPSLLIILGYFVMVPNYELNASVNNQSSFGSVLESLLIVLAGGDVAALRDKFAERSMDAVLIAVPVALGFMIAFASVLYRRGHFRRMDMRLGLLVLSILPAYIAVRPTAYFPRYSWAPLPLALIISAFLLHSLFSKDEQSS